jgi:ribosomal protein L40E
MTFCSNCGTKLADEAKFCSGCGTPVVSAHVEINQEKAVNIIQAQPSTLPISTVSQNQNALMPGEVYCQSCGARIKKEAEVCVKCGVSKPNALLNRTEIFCFSCGNKMRSAAENCPKCGVNQKISFNKGEKDKKGLAKASLVLGIIGVLGGIESISAVFSDLGAPPAMIPYSIVNILALIFAIMGLNSSKKNMAIAGLIMSIVGLVGSITGLIFYWNR